MGGFVLKHREFARQKNFIKEGFLNLKMDLSMCQNIFALYVRTLMMGTRRGHRRGQGCRKHLKLGGA